MALFIIDFSLWIESINISSASKKTLPPPAPSWHSDKISPLLRYGYITFSQHSITIRTPTQRKSGVFWWVFRFVGLLFWAVWEDTTWWFWRSFFFLGGTRPHVRQYWELGKWEHIRFLCWADCVLATLLGCGVWLHVLVFLGYCTATKTSARTCSSR